MTEKRSDEVSAEIVEAMVGEMLSSPEDFNFPLYVISGSGTGWFLDPETHQMVQVNRGTEIVPIGSLDPEDEEKVLVRAPYRFLLIPQKEVQEIGWN